MLASCVYQLLSVLCMLLLSFSCCSALLCPSLPSGYGANASTHATIVTPDNRTRSFIVYLPPSYPASQSHVGYSATGFPLVLLLHPGLSTAALAEKRYGMNEQAALHSFIVVYPQGTGVVSVNSSWNAGGGCCGVMARTGVDDVLFLRLLVESLSTELCIDSTAVFSTGISDGAIMTQRLGCDASFSPLLAAVAPVEGTLPPAPFHCNSTTPLSVLEVHGTNDTNIPFVGGTGCGHSGTAFTSVPTSLTSWTTEQRCARVFSLAAPNVTDLDARLFEYGPCNGPLAQPARVSIEFVLIEGGGHTWSGAGPQHNGVNCSAAVGEWPASERIWSFFDTHRQASNRSTVSIANSSTSAWSGSKHASTGAPSSTSTSTCAPHCPPPASLSSACAVRPGSSASRSSSSSTAIGCGSDSSSGCIPVDSSSSSPQTIQPASSDAVRLSVSMAHAVGVWCLVAISAVLYGTVL